MPETLVTALDLHQAVRSDLVLPLLLENSPESIVVTDVDANIVYVNPRFCTLTGYRLDELLGRNPRVLSTGHTDSDSYQRMWQQLTCGEPWRGTFLNRKKNGETYWEDARILPVRDANGVIVRYLGIKEEISERLRMQDKMARLVHYDALTGLANRERLARETLQRAQARRDALVLFCLDLDGFAAVCARVGTVRADALLCALADGLSVLAGTNGVAARLGEDEFALLADAAHAERLAQALPQLLASLEPALLASIGQATLRGAPEGGMPPGRLLRYALQAMHAAKQAGGNQLHVYREDALPVAGCASRAMLHDGSLVLFYQPIVHPDGALAGVEALLRRRRADGCFEPPAEVLLAFAADGLALELDLYVLAQALAQSVAWRKAGIVTDISVNLHAQTLQSPGFVAQLAALLDAHGLAAQPGLTLEILEGVALTDLERASAIVSECRALGVGVAIDDFGSAYASLGYLRSLPVSRIKLERSFVQAMFDDEGARVIVETVHALAAAFGTVLVAEGVETERHARHLAQLGSLLMQGYAFAHPMPPDDFVRWLGGRGR